MTGTSKANLMCIRCKKIFTNRKGASIANGIVFCAEHKPVKQKVKNDCKTSSS